MSDYCEEEKGILFLPHEGKMRQDITQHEPTMDGEQGQKCSDGAVDIIKTLHALIQQKSEWQNMMVQHDHNKMSGCELL